MDHTVCGVGVVRTAPGSSHLPERPSQRANRASYLACSRLVKGWICLAHFASSFTFASCRSSLRVIQWRRPRADYLNAKGRDAFAELVVPAAGVRMLQWTGRAVRTETDERR